MVLPVGDVNPTRRRAWITGAVLLANLVVHLAVQLPLEGCEAQAFVYRYGVVPRELWTWAPLGSVELEQLLGPCAEQVVGTKSVPLSLLTSMFLHGGLGHLVGNLLFLWVFGNNVEDRLGHARFVVFYLAGGVAATGVFAAVQPTTIVPLLGASGAIAAILGAYLLLHPRAQVLVYAPFPIYLLAFVVPSARLRSWWVLFAIVTLPAWLLLGGWFALQALSARDTLADGVAYEAHLGGFVAGILLLLVLDRGRRRRGRPPFHPARPSGRRR